MTPDRVERASDADLAFLAMDRGPVPEQLAVVLVLDRPLTVAACARLLTERVPSVPVRDMIPIVVGGATNITVSFVALSYLDTLVVTAVADPVACPELDRLATFLSADLAEISRIQRGERL